MTSLQTLILPAAISLILYLFLTVLQRPLHRIRLLRKIKLPLNLIFLVFAIQLFLHFSKLSVHSKVSLWLDALLVLFFFYLGIRLADTYLFEFFLTPRKRAQIPLLLRDIIRWCLVIIAFFLILNVMLGINLGPLVITSAALTVILGLALQETLGNLFSGISLNLERPFEIGDWITIGGHTGCVVDMSWRATKIRTFSNDYILIPNASIAKQEIINYYVPDKIHARFLKIGVSYEAVPNEVKKAILEAINETKGILKKPSPIIRLVDYGDFSISYSIEIWIQDFPHYREIEDELMTKLWYRFKREGITIPFPIRNVNLQYISERRKEETRKALIEQIVLRLTPIEIFSLLSSEEMTKLAEAVIVKHYAAREILVHQGESADSFYVINKGKVDVSVSDPQGRTTSVAQLGPDAFFGEMSLLTGEKRAATITALEDTEVLVINKESFRQILNENPQIAESLSKVMEKRQRENLEKMTKIKELTPEQKAAISSDSILKKIRTFFEL
ncbi:MAG: cyclic nucleotide-binding domain-containing protein [Candidatus Edwardsbacteria bacterium]